MANTTILSDTVKVYFSPNAEAFLENVEKKGVTRLYWRIGPTGALCLLRRTTDNSGECSKISVIGSVLRSTANELVLSAGGEARMVERDKTFWLLEGDFFKLAKAEERPKTR